MKYVGIDYHKRYSVVCILNEAGESVAEERIEHVFLERFQQFLSPHAPCPVGFEATMNGGWLREILEEIAGIERLVWAHPLQARLIAAAQVKTDQVDARQLAQLLRAGLLPASHIPDRATRLRKEVLRQRTFWGRQRTRVRNRIHRRLGRQHGLDMPQVSDLFGRKGRAALAQRTLPSPEDRLLRQQLTGLEALDAPIRELEKRISRLGQDEPAIGLLATIPGLGPLLGHVMATEIDGMERFDPSERFCAYAGLTDSHHLQVRRQNLSRTTRERLQPVAAVGVGGSRVGGGGLFAVFRRVLSSSPRSGQESQYRHPDYGSADVPNHLLCAPRTASVSVARVEPTTPRRLSWRTDGASRVSAFAGVLGQSREPGL